MNALVRHNFNQEEEASAPVFWRHNAMSITVNVSKHSSSDYWDIDFGDGTIVTPTSATTTHTYTTAGIKDIRLIGDLSAVKDVTMSDESGLSCSLTGMTNIEDVNIRYNSNLTELILGGSSTSFSIQAKDCDIQNALDFSNYVFKGACELRNSNNLDSVTFGNNGGYLSLDFRGTSVASIDVLNNELTGSIHFSGVTELTNINLGTSPRSITRLDFQGTNVDTLDFSGLTNISGFINYRFASSLETVIFGAGSGQFNTFRIQSSNLTSVNGLNLQTNVVNKAGRTLDIRNGNLSASEINKILVHLDTNATAGIASTINLSGNTAPDTTSGGNDGIAAKNSLIAKGRTVTTD